MEEDTDGSKLTIDEDAEEGEEKPEEGADGDNSKETLETDGGDEEEEEGKVEEEEEDTLEDGRTLTQWLRDARDAGVIELWEDGRIQPVAVPLETLEPFLSVRGFQELTRRITNNTDAIFADLETGFRHFLDNRSAMAALPSPRPLNLSGVSGFCLLTKFAVRFDCLC